MHSDIKFSFSETGDGVSKICWSCDGGIDNISITGIGPVIAIAKICNVGVGSFFRPTQQP